MSVCCPGRAEMITLYIAFFFNASCSCSNVCMCDIGLVTSSLLIIMSHCLIDSKTTYTTFSDTTKLHKYNIYMHMHNSTTCIIYNVS